MAVQLLASNIATANALDLTEADHAVPQQQDCATGLKASLSRRFGNAARHLQRGTVRLDYRCVSALKRCGQLQQSITGCVTSCDDGKPPEQIASIA